MGNQPRLGTDSIHIPPTGAVISLDMTIDMKGQKPTVVPGNEKGLIGHNLHEDSADSSSGRKLQSGTRTVLAVRVILNDGSYNFASQTGLSNDVFGSGIINSFLTICRLGYVFRPQ